MPTNESDETYEAPDVTEVGSVEDVTLAPGGGGPGGGPGGGGPRPGGPGQPPRGPGWDGSR